MDIKGVNRRFEQLAREKETDTIYDSRSKLQLFRQAIQERGEHLADQYLNCAEGFRQLFAVVGVEDRNGYEKVSCPIKLAIREDETLGRGVLLARILTWDDLDRLYDARTQVLFVAEDTTVEHKLDEEAFSTTGFTFGGGHQFLSPNYAWARSEDVWHGFYVEKSHVRAAENELSNVIRKATETQVMLWDAINNLELNPELAARAKQLQEV